MPGKASSRFSNDIHFVDSTGVAAPVAAAFAVVSAGAADCEDDCCAAGWDQTTGLSLPTDDSSKLDEDPDEDDTIERQGLLGGK